MTLPQYPAEAVERLGECLILRDEPNRSDIIAILSYVEGMKWQESKPVAKADLTLSLINWNFDDELKIPVPMILGAPQEVTPEMIEAADRIYVERFPDNPDLARMTEEWWVETWTMLYEAMRSAAPLFGKGSETPLPHTPSWEG